MANIPIFIRFMVYSFFIQCIVITMIQIYQFGAKLTLLEEKSYENVATLKNLGKKDIVLCPLIVESVLIMTLVVGQISVLLLIKKSYQLVQRVFSEMDLILSTINTKYSP